MKKWIILSFISLFFLSCGKKKIDYTFNKYYGSNVTFSNSFYKCTYNDKDTVFYSYSEFLNFYKSNNSCKIIDFGSDIKIEKENSEGIQFYVDSIAESEILSSLINGNLNSPFEFKIPIYDEDLQLISSISYTFEQMNFFQIKDANVTTQIGFQKGIPTYLDIIRSSCNWVINRSIDCNKIYNENQKAVITWKVVFINELTTVNNLIKDKYIQFSIPQNSPLIASENETENKSESNTNSNYSEVIEKEENIEIIDNTKKNNSQNIIDNKNKENDYIQSNENRFALIIGNENYIQGGGIEADVTFALNDAQSFKKYSIAILGIPEKNIIYVENGTRTQMKTNIDLFLNLMNIDAENREFFVYYAGHGLPDTSKDAYLMPIDIKQSYIEDAIRLSEFYQKIIAKKPKKVTIFLDACFSGGGRTGDNLIAARSGVRIKPNKEEINGNLLIFAATSENQVSKPYAEKQHGMFTYFLLKALKDSKGNITYDELTSEVINNVSTYSLTINKELQTPVVNVSKNISSTWENWKIN